MIPGWIPDRPIKFQNDVQNSVYFRFPKRPFFTPGAPPIHPGDFPSSPSNIRKV